MAKKKNPEAEAPEAEAAEPSAVEASETEAPEAAHQANLDAEMTADTLTVDIADAEITEISFKAGGSTGVKFTTDDTGVPKSVTFKSPAPLHPEFIDARDKLIDLVLELMEIPARRGNPITITGVAFKTDSSEDERPGAVIKAKRKFSSSLGEHPLNTPVRFLDHPQGQKSFSAEQWRLLVKVRAEARHFLGGKSAQPSLFDQEAADKAEADLKAVDDSLFGEAAGDGQATEAPARPAKTVGKKRTKKKPDPEAEKLTDDEYDQGPPAGVTAAA